MNSVSSFAPGCSPLQKATAEKGGFPPVPANCVVTGGTGFVGLRLVEMLVERGAKRVVAFDIVPVEKLPEEARSTVWKDKRIEYVVGDISNYDDLKKATIGADCVWHIAAAVGPFHPKVVYTKVNVTGTQNVVQACKENGVKKIVMASSPSTRMNGDDIDGLREDQLPSYFDMQGRFLQPYAETKMIGEKFCRESSSKDLFTVAVAPHQVYGPRDNLFLPNVLEAAGVGKLRIFGNGKNRVCFTYVDNYCHGLIIAERALFEGSDAVGKFYIVTDGSTHPHPEGYLVFWEEMDNIITNLGFEPLKNKMKLPHWFLFPIAYFCALIAFLFHLQIRLSPFTLKTLTMHRWFRTDNAERDLKYQPIVSFQDGWKDTENWFRKNWLPKFEENVRLGQNHFTTISSTTKSKIDIHSQKKIK